MLFAGHATAALRIDVAGTPGTGVTTWIFSGSTTAVPLFETSLRSTGNVNYSFADGVRFSTMSGNIFASTAPALPSDDLFTLTGSPMVTVAGTARAITQIFLDDDTHPNNDELGIRVNQAVSYNNGNAVEWNGRGTIAFDINNFVTDVDFVQSSGIFGGGGSDPLIFRATTGAANAPPTVTIATVPADANIVTGGALTLTATGDDTDGDTLTYSWSADAGVFTDDDTATPSWTHDAAGTVTLTVTVTDGNSGSVTGTVTATVSVPPNTPPTANDDTARVGVGESVAVDVLANDRDGDGDALTVTAVGAAGNGTVAIAADGSDLTYTHDGGDADADAFTYTVSDGNASATATVSVTIGDDTAAVDAMLADAVLPTVVREVGAGTVNAIAGRIGRVFDGGGASSSFTVANFNFADGAADHRTFWADADYLNFDGDDDGVDYDGDLTAITVGADATVGKNKLAGVAVSVSESEVDYQTSLGDGEQKLSLTSLHPYFAWRDADANFWASVGYGEGELALSPDGADKVKRDADLRTLGVGGERKFWADGERDAKVRARLVHSELEVDADGDLAGFELDAYRATLGLEFARERRLADGTLTTTSGVAVRQDGGDGDGGGGAEVGGELRYAGDGVTLNLRGHFLFGRADYDEWNIAGGVVVTPKHGRGLSFNFTPTVDHADDMQLQTELGYGMSFRESLLTPFTKLTDDTVNIGAKLITADNWRTSLTATRNDAADTVVLKLNLDL